VDIKEKKFEYDTLYNATLELLKGRNLCEFDENGLCKRSRFRQKNGFKQEDIIYCCCGPFTGSKLKIEKPCEKFIEGKGCGTCALNCRLWFCDQVVIPSDLAEKINIIKCIAEGKGFMIFRGDFNDYLKSLDKIEKKDDNKKKRSIFFWKRG